MRLADRFRFVQVERGGRNFVKPHQKEAERKPSQSVLPGGGFSQDSSNLIPLEHWGHRLLSPVT